MQVEECKSEKIHRAIQIGTYESGIQIGKYNSGNTFWEIRFKRIQTEEYKSGNSSRTLQIGKYKSENTNLKIQVEKPTFRRIQIVKIQFGKLKGENTNL